MSREDFEKSIRSHYSATSSFLSGFALMWVDCIMLLLSIGAGFLIVNFINFDWINFKSFVRYAVFFPFIILIFWSCGLYPGILLAPEEEVKRFSSSTFFSFFGIGVALLIIRPTVIVPKTDPIGPIALAFMVSWPFATLLLPLGREIGRRVFGKFKWWGVPAVIYSKGMNGDIIADRLLSRKYLGYKPVIIITDMENPPYSYKGVPVRKPSEDIFSIIKALKIKVAIVCDYDKDLINIQTHYRYMIRVPRNQLTTTMSLHMKDFGGILGFSSTNHLTRGYSLLGKRLIDLGLIIIMLPLLLPLMVIIALLVKLTSKGPVFYGHKRVGKNHKTLKCWKFRTMCVDSEEKLKQILATDPVRAAEWERDRKFVDDPRVTKFGKFLRKTSLDELPQLFNILAGQMSFVGPRPVTEGELEKYGDYADYVLSVKPGLSGMWQISGRSDTGYEERITLDTYYIQNWSIWLDIWIIIKTVWVVLKGKGAY